VILLTVAGLILLAASLAVFFREEDVPMANDIEFDSLSSSHLDTPHMQERGNQDVST
jgi:hypothetical protein